MATLKADSRIFGLDFLRMLAISGVILSHGRYFWGPVVPGSYRLFVLGIGVDVFFVLSGFLIGGILIRDLEAGPSVRGLTRFWARRWMRTLPNYFLFLALNLLMPAGHIAGRDHSEHLGRYFLFLQNFDHQAPRFFEESWSLSIEEWFYLTVPLVAFAIATYRPGRRSSVLVAALTIGLFSLGGRLLTMNSTAIPLLDLQRGVIFRLDSIAFGVAAAWLSATWPGFWVRLRIPGLVVGLPMLFWLIGFRLTDGMNTPAGRLLFSDGCALAVVGLLPILSTWQSGSGLLGRGVVRISQWSYSMYLINTPFLVLAGIWIAPASTIGGALVRWLAWVSVVTVASWACYRFYERPMTALREVDWRRKLARNPGSSPASLTHPRQEPPAPKLASSSKETPSRLVDDSAPS